MTGTSLPTEIAEDQTVAIPSNTNATATDLTIPASSGIIIKSGASLTVSGTLTNSGTANNIIIEDGGQLVYYDNGAKDAVQATVQKSITGYGAGNDKWNFIASPITSDMSPASVTNLLGEALDTNPVTYNYDLYRLNNTTWENYHQHNDENNGGLFMLANDHGYLYAKSSNTTLEFAGTVKPYDADHTISVTQGWNLIGNPYTFDAYVNVPYYAMNDAGSGITAEIAVSDKVTVKPCTGIVIKAEENSSVKFLDAAPSGAVNNGNIQMTLSQQATNRGTATTLDNAIVSFNEGTQLKKFYFGEQNANIFIPQGDEEYAIVNVSRDAMHCAPTEMPVNFKAKEEGEYTISVNVEDVEMDYLHLIDNIAGNDVDLLTHPSYTFNASNDDYPSRFRLVFSTINNENEDENENFAFISNGQIVITGDACNASLQVIDMMGRIVSTEQVNGNSVRLANLAKGVYVLRLVGNKVMTQKIVVE